MGKDSFYNKLAHSLRTQDQLSLRNGQRMLGGRELVFLAEKALPLQGRKEHSHTYREIFTIKMDPHDGKYTESVLWDWDIRFRYVYERINCDAMELTLAITDHYAEQMKLHPQNA